MEECDISLDKERWSEDLKEITKRFKYEENIRINIYNSGTMIGFTEIRLEDDSQDDLGERYFIDWIEICESHRRKGYLKQFIMGLKKLGKHISGGVADYYLYHVWEDLGGQFKNTWEFVIPSDGREIEMVL